MNTLQKDFSVSWCYTKTKNKKQKKNKTKQDKTKEQKAC